jgi:hypothetical protein
MVAIVESTEEDSPCNPGLFTAPKAPIYTPAIISYRGLYLFGADVWM